MKKIILMFLALITLSGCSLFKDDLEDATIYTTTYPIEFLMETLYGEYGQIESIYPADADVYSYELTEKQINEYSKSDLFIYNGLSNEKNIAKNLINKNNSLLIIDVSYGLTYTYGLEELWLSPNNYLMLAKNIKDNLNQYLKSRTIIDAINEKYNTFAETISLMDADLRTIGKEAKEKGHNTLVVTDDVFNFLTNYGFNIISLDDDTINDGVINTVENGYKNKTYEGIIVSDGQKSEAVSKIISDHSVKEINIDTMTNKPAEDNYIVIMQRFIDDIRNLVLAD